MQENALKQDAENVWTVVALYVFVAAICRRLYETQIIFVIRNVIFTSCRRLLFTRLAGISQTKILVGKELPSQEEIKYGLDVLKENNNTVDYIITHSPSTSELYLIGCKGLYEPDILTNYLEEVKASIEYKRHLFGHMHINKAINDRDICLYEQIIRIL